MSGILGVSRPVGRVLSAPSAAREPPRRRPVQRFRPGQPVSSNAAVACRGARCRAGRPWQRRLPRRRGRPRPRPRSLAGGEALVLRRQGREPGPRLGEGVVAPQCLEDTGRHQRRHRDRQRGRGRCAREFTVTETISNSLLASGRSSGVRGDAMVGLAVPGQDPVRVGDGPVQSQATIGLHVLDCPPGAAVCE